jgi:DNA-binding NarL/FixJ family response regulator
MDILIVEDSQSVRRMIRDIVLRPSDRCFECSDDDQALAAYAEHRPDCVLMNIEMNGVDGIAATTRIRAAFPGAKIVVLASYDDAELRGAALAAGACAYVLKDEMYKLRALLTDWSLHCPAPRSPHVSE